LAILGPISENYLRHLLAEIGIPVEAPFGGVRQKTFDELEQSLIEMEEAYASAQSTGDRPRATQCRRVVIQAKDHARLAALSPKTPAAKKTMKEEMVAWMLVWLENPAVFPTWVKLRKLKM
jgi:hypothetical protein